MSSMQTGVAVVIRDHEGRVVAALSKKLHYPFGPLEAEAKAMEDAVEFAMLVFRMRTLRATHLYSLMLFKACVIHQ